ncbi:MAG: hypothetical protein H8E03_00865 [Pelagibacteraceae bacterium]|nr:hypothetical protein [Pelagibacteraceae bacterium]
MKFELVNKRTNEIVDSSDLESGVGVSGARTFFKGIKKLPGKQFDELFSVRVGSSKKRPILGQYKWWKEEPTKFDEF